MELIPPRQGRTGQTNATVRPHGCGKGVIPGKAREIIPLAKSLPRCREIHRTPVFARRRLRGPVGHRKPAGCHLGIAYRQPPYHPGF
ncbi:unnamed protein product [marine sediment metagenome]|uniref:Uncharacterized protein n=1 Tax=marine sediment metagenome TaxID=412755 RepID=X1TQ85_9ZZZZ